MIDITEFIGILVLCVNDTFPVKSRNAVAWVNSTFVYLLKSNFTVIERDCCVKGASVWKRQKQTSWASGIIQQKRHFEIRRMIFLWAR